MTLKSGEFSYASMSPVSNGEIGYIISKEFFSALKVDGAMILC